MKQNTSATRQAQGRKMRSKRNEVNIRMTDDGIAEICERVKAQNPNIPAPDLWRIIFSIGLNEYAKRYEGRRCE